MGEVLAVVEDAEHPDDYHFAVCPLLIVLAVLVDLVRALGPDLRLVQQYAVAERGPSVGRSNVARAFNVNQLEALIQSCESNRRHIAGWLEGDG